MTDNLAPLLYADEAQCVNNLLAALPWDDTRASRAHDRAADLVMRVRGAKRKIGELESFFQQYGLDTEEGLALMTLAEALLRIPDAATAGALIRDKMVAADWLAAQGESKDWLVKAAGMGLSLTRKTLDSALSKVGEPVIRKAMVEAMRMLGRQFVLGETIEDALKNAKGYEKKGYRVSYDMLGEGARTMDDAQRYYRSYHHAIEAIGKAAAGFRHRPGISVKLSALHPRYIYRHHERCVPEMIESLTGLVRFAADRDIALTVDAEEVDRLEMSLAVIEAVARDRQLNGWEGFGLAIQSYSKRTHSLIDTITGLARDAGRRMQVRLVKGAYWDTEVKRAQVQGLPDYTVFTRKMNTDLSYLACAHKLLERRDIFFPQFATHNAHSIAAVMELAGNDRAGFEFQRLHGMGETLHDLVLGDRLADVCVYAPCGSHQDLLPDLVRRLLENGANGNFVNQLLDPDTPVDSIIADPVRDAAAHELKRHPKIPLPRDIYGKTRINSAGFDLTEPTVVEPLMAAMKRVDDKQCEAAPLVGGKILKPGAAHDVRNPAIMSQTAGKVWMADDAAINAAFAAARAGQRAWNDTPADARAACLLRLADLMERHGPELMGLCLREAGKTAEDALAELREAVDFCRYYAQQGAHDFAPRSLPGPTGERNILTLHGRGIFVCISPWNFPLAIFMGQVSAALMAGNAVIAKPAEQTPLIAMRAAQLILEAGVPADVFALLPGAGDVGAKIVAHADVAGVAFTGSTEVARVINRALAAKDGPIAALIAETGGQNAMIVDSSALLEQVIDDTLVSAFGSTGQRCSALRVLCVQEDIADKLIEMLHGAVAEMKVGDPADLASDNGPVIDGDALMMLQNYRDKMTREARLIAQAPLPQGLNGHYFAPVAFEIPSVKTLGAEIFGPVLHVVRYKASALDRLMADLNATGYGLTLGVHSRIDSHIRAITADMDVGNAYVNRTMIGAVVGVQPFGGRGLSGTGPKAGGPHYLPRFATEKTITTDTTRQGGNATLVSLTED
jgi:RHH-type proline utilization regulon transcriptional repressor/proline dehydrogenase/delta 1-pyrroline-5-carboxylate dehydrogenase